MTNRKTPRGILETIVYSNDLPAAREFYEQVIGLTVVAYEPECHLMLRVGRSMLLVFDPDDSQTKEIFVGNAMIPQHGCSGRSH
ncbi:MAG: VOC family protein, partial [Planctomycetota bacterium]|nr:VOC family protein [Planctomycetota bacterium]